MLEHATPGKDAWREKRPRAATTTARNKGTVNSVRVIATRMEETSSDAYFTAFRNFYLFFFRTPIMRQAEACLFTLELPESSPLQTLSKAEKENRKKKGGGNQTKSKWVSLRRFQPARCATCGAAVAHLGPTFGCFWRLGRPLPPPIRDSLFLPTRLSQGPREQTPVSRTDKRALSRF